jgi:osmotically-inducible protein OsmY
MNPSFFTLSLLVLAGCSRSGATDGPDVALASPAKLGRSDAERIERPIDLSTSDHVRQALLGDALVAPDAGAIRVTTRDGAVTLSGFVRSAVGKQRAAVVAKVVGNVLRVDDQLVVDAEAAKTQQPMESVVDRTISDRVRLALRDDRAIAADCRTVSVVTQDGVVRLTGTVGSEAAKSRFSVVARAVGSVKSVDNRLEVKQPWTPAPARNPSRGWGLSARPARDRRQHRAERTAHAGTARGRGVLSFRQRSASSIRCPGMRRRRLHHASFHSWCRALQGGGG